MSEYKVVDVYKVFKDVMKRFKLTYDNFEIRISDVREDSVEMNFETTYFSSAIAEYIAWDLDIRTDKVGFAVFPRNNTVMVYLTVYNILKKERK